MLRRISAILGIAVLTTFAVPSAAMAAESTDYTPDTVVSATLAGSTAVATCVADAAYIDFSVSLTDPSNVATNHTATLVMTDGTSSVEIPLGALQNNQLSGRVLWPGASVGADGRGNGWPGWAFQNGQWVETAGNYAWTRGRISAEIRVNPTLAVPLSYPPATPQCLTDPAGFTASTASAGTLTALPVTGASALIVPISIAGILVVLTGLVMLIVRRRAHVDQ
ncbi:LPXTG cell wall anchor domain-containing protein [Microbacterium sp. CJ88]|uniref:LPXTG cell wall anchor domain-containing protein n=1 Tax=Microbacterium sp. CJ88 TaxID=3445672 RepID=UPI003F657ABF